MFLARPACMLIAMALLVACASDARVATQDPPTASASPTATEPTDNNSGDDAPTDQNSEVDVNPKEPDAPSAQSTAAEATPDAVPTATATPVPTAEPIPATTEPVPTETPEPTRRCVRLTDFALEAENLSWFIVNDNVMGGRSNGGPTFADSVMVFEGEINTNGGGFSSVRIPLGEGAFAGFNELHVRARTDGRAYKLTLEDSLATRDRRVSQQGALEFTATADWQTATVRFQDLDPRIFGRAVDSEAFRPDLATQLGVMISDGVDGPFRIEIDWIDVCE